MAHIWMQHDSLTLTHSCVIYSPTGGVSTAWPMTHLSIHHVNESCHTYERVDMNESCHTYEWDAGHTYEWVMPHMWRRLGHWGGRHHVTHDSSEQESCEWVMSYSYVCHDSFMCVTWLIHMCDMTHSCVWHDSFICVTWLIHVCDMTHSYMKWWGLRLRTHLSIYHCTHINESRHTYEWVMSHMWMSHGTHVNESCHTYEWDMAHI